MGNIIDYIEQYGGYSFSERPFSDEDSLVFAQFAYLKMGNIVPAFWGEENWVTLGEMNRAEGKEEMFADLFFPEENRILFEKMRKSLRFQTVRVCGYINRIDSRKSLQFSAVTYLLEDGLAYIAFRGTDEKLAGWKEDFRMAYMSPVESQLLSVEYLNRAGHAVGSRLLVGGHSKGGNLAIYASMYCEDSVRKRIQWIYNMDGPGFHPEIQSSSDYGKIADRIRKIIPHSSLIGMLLENTRAYEVVESSSFGMLQHNPFTWLIKEGKFVTVEDIYKSRKAAMEIVNRWIISLTEEEIGIFVEELFAVLEASEMETVQELPEKWRQILGHLVEAIRCAQPETKKEFGIMFRAFTSSAREVLMHRHTLGGQGHTRPEP